MTDVFYLFKESQSRRRMLEQILAGADAGLTHEQLFGFPELLRQGQALDCNLLGQRPYGIASSLWHRFDQFLAPKTGIGLGDELLVRAHLARMNRSRLVLATNDNVGLPAARLRARRRLKTPLVYISIGLPERMQSVSAISKQRAEKYRRVLAKVDCFVAYGHAEAGWIRDWLGDTVPVAFLPFGVDTAQWHPVEHMVSRWDVLSIGADPMRDFGLFIEYARQRPVLRFGWITSRERRAECGSIPRNVDVQTNLPVRAVMDAIAAAKLIVLPVKENSYSGATTTLLQCMAMGKAVAVSRVGAICNGYGFEDGVHLRWMKPGSVESLAAAADGLLADADTALRVGDAARRHVTTNLNWHRYVERLKEVLNSGWIKNG